MSLVGVKIYYFCSEQGSKESCCNWGYKERLERREKGVLTADRKHTRTTFQGECPPGVYFTPISKLVCFVCYLKNVNTWPCLWRHSDVNVTYVACLHLFWYVEKKKRDPYFCYGITYTGGQKWPDKTRFKPTLFHIKLLGFSIIL